MDEPGATSYAFSCQEKKYILIIKSPILIHMTCRLQHEVVITRRVPRSYEGASEVVSMQASLL